MEWKENGVQCNGRKKRFGDEDLIEAGRSEKKKECEQFGRNGNEISCRKRGQRKRTERFLCEYTSTRSPVWRMIFVWKK